MRIVDWVKNTYHRLSRWMDRNFGPDRLTFQPRIINADPVETEALKELKKAYRFHQTTNIAVTGGKSVGKKSVVKTFETERLFSASKFIRFDFREFANLYLNTTDPSSMLPKLDTYILKSITSRAHQGELSGLNGILPRGPERVYRKPLNTFVTIAILFVFLLSRDQLIDNIVKRLPETWHPNDVSLGISIICIFLLVMSVKSLIRYTVAFWPLKWLRIKVTSKIPQVELSVEENAAGSSEDQKNIIYALNKMRWKIGHTVVFENMEALGKEAFPITVTHLCTFNRRINDYITAWKLWNVTPIKRPIRFIYIFRDDLVQLGVDKPLYDVVIYIRQTLKADHAFNELERAFTEEISKNGSIFPLGKLFPVDPNFDVNVSGYIADRRILNMIIKRSIQWYSDFSKRIQPESPTQKDIHGLFSFALFSLFFPKECSKIIDNTSVIFTKRSSRDSIDPKYLDLFEYFISEKCPEEYRITFLSKRYVGLQPELRDKHLAAFHRAYANKDYSTALNQIEKAICCAPNDNELTNLRKEVLCIMNDTQ